MKRRDAYLQANTVWPEKKNEILTRATTWMDLAEIMLSERSLSQKIAYCMIPLILNAQCKPI